ncbi:MAG: HDOD domain-containing protein [Planctomycetota bacterium]|nr:HDOD domain-containing protein [Planctomycetota bacterium]
MTQNTFVLPESFAIPTMPAVAARISKMLQDPNVGLKEVAQVVAQDAPLAAKVLKIANSSFYGLSERCISTQQAAAILGVRVLRTVVLQAAVMKQFEHLKGAGIDLNEIWRHSVVTAQACSYVVQRAQKRVGITNDEAYTCGLLHDLGEVVMIDNLKDFYVKFWVRARADSAPLFMAEQHALGFTHADVGGRVATQWGLPHQVVRAISLHHVADVDATTEPVAAIISRVNTIVERVAVGNKAGAAGVFAGAAGAVLGITPDVESATIDFVSDALQNVEL